MTEFTYNNNTLLVNNKPVLTDITDTVSFENGLTGVFAGYQAIESSPTYKINLGQPQGMERFMSSNRSYLFWMTTNTGSEISDIPGETQFLLLKHDSGGYLLMVPLVVNPYRSSLKGTAEGIMVCAETGSEKTAAAQADICYIAYGTELRELVHNSLKDIAERYRTFRLHEDKKVPEIVNYFGWCTWDAFYKAVSEEKMLDSIKGIQQKGVPVGFIILDDGWQEMQHNAQPDWTLKDNVWEDRLIGFETNAKFPSGLSGLVKAAKEKLGVHKFYAWHSFNGYWAGVDKEALPQFDVDMVTTRFSDNLRERATDSAVDFWQVDYGLVPPGQINNFYHQYHSRLRQQGIDGVKVDVQARLEALGEDYGGRVNLMEAYHQALEGSVHVHFNGELINCMSCSNDMIFNTLNSNLVRSSDDFYPHIPHAHGKHIRDNAYVSLWLGEIMQPDWDMFKSSHELGAFHAASRAISGGPVYVSDQVDEFNMELIQQLVLCDGTIPRCLEPGRPTADCLFYNPCEDDVLLKIQNINQYGAIIGAFQCQYHEEPAERKALAGSIRPSDIDSVTEGTYAVYAAGSGELHKCQVDEAVSLTLNEGEYDLFTIMPVENGFAPIGLTTKMNPGGCISGIDWFGAEKCHLYLKDGGILTAYSEREITQITCNGQQLEFQVNGNSVSVTLPESGPQCLELSF